MSRIKPLALAHQLKPVLFTDAGVPPHVGVRHERIALAGQHHHPHVVSAHFGKQAGQLGVLTPVAGFAQADGQYIALAPHPQLLVVLVPHASSSVEGRAGPCRAVPGTANADKPGMTASWPQTSWAVSSGSA
jgi:hypothetical protein